jgi:DNA-binding MarR family transcriptional regulator
MTTIKNDIDSFGLGGKYDKIVDTRGLTLEDIGALVVFFESDCKEINVDIFRREFGLSRMKMQRIMKNLEKAGFAELVRLKGKKNFAGTQWQLIYK